MRTSEWAMMGRQRRASKTLPLSWSGDIDLVSQYPERVTDAGELLQPLNRDRRRFVLGLSELARCYYACRR